jgi:hypothetical protein
MEKGKVVDIVALVKSIIGLLGVLLLLVLFFVYRARHKHTSQESMDQKPPENKADTKVEVAKRSFEDLVRVIKRKDSDYKALTEATAEIIEHYGEIPPKMGLRIHEDFFIYRELIVRLCRHPNTDKKLILEFFHALLKRNPNYNKEINEALTKGLHSLG